MTMSKIYLATGGSDGGVLEYYNRRLTGMLILWCVYACRNKGIVLTIDRHMMITTIIRGILQ